MTTIDKPYYLFNQMAGPLFRELAEAIAAENAGPTKLLTGHPDTVALGNGANGLQIIAMPSYDKTSKLRRLLSWIHFTLYSIPAFCSMSRDSRALIVSNPPLIALVALIARIFGRKYYVLVYDMFPDTLIALGHLSERSMVARIWIWINRQVWNRSEGVFTIGKRMAEKLSQQFDENQTPTGSVNVVPVWVDTQKIRPVDRSENSFAANLGIENQTVVLYSGNMGYSHDIDSVLKAAQLLSGDPGIVFVLIGEGAKWQDAYDFKQSRNLPNLMVLPFQPEAMLPMSLSMADISLVALDKGAEGLMIPSKTYYYMAAGSAVIAICEGGSELKDTVEAANCGYCVTPGEPETLANLIKTLADNKVALDQLKYNARVYCCAHHDREKSTQTFVRTLC